MANDSVVVDCGSNITFGLLVDFFSQLEAGKRDPGKGISGEQVRLLLEHRNPFMASHDRDDGMPLRSGDVLTIQKGHGQWIVMFSRHGRTISTANCCIAKPLHVKPSESVLKMVEQLADLIASVNGLDAHLRKSISEEQFIYELMPAHCIIAR